MLNYKQKHILAKQNQYLKQCGAREINNVLKNVIKIMQSITEDVLNKSKAWIMNKETW